VSSNWLTHITTADAKDTFWRQEIACETEWWRKYLERDRGSDYTERREAIEALKRKHDAELIDLRRRCINYVTARQEADIAAGKCCRDGFEISAALSSVPLRVEHDGQCVPEIKDY